MMRWITGKQMRFCFCRECFASFNSVRCDAKYCSARCRQRASRAARPRRKGQGKDTTPPRPNAS